MKFKNQDGPVTDSETTIACLKDLVLRFSQERDWEQFHAPKDLGVALAIEVGELLEHIRYRSDAAVKQRLEQPEFRQEFGHELADCFWLILRLAEVTGVDLAAALEEKVALAALKYPVDKVRGLPHKYTHYDQT